MLEEVIAKLKGLSGDTLKSGSTDVLSDEIPADAAKTTTTKEAPDDADRPVIIEPSSVGARLESLEDIRETKMIDCNFLLRTNIINNFFFHIYAQ